MGGKLKDKKYDLKERTFNFAQSMLDLAGKLPRRTECMIIQNQLAKSGTSIGANVEEADGTITKKDFAYELFSQVIDEVIEEKLGTLEIEPKIIGYKMMAQLTPA